ncbi:MAG: Trm112 family protein [Candidatus Bathyarchaeia archaeon]
MKRRLMDILACPIDKHYPLDLFIFEEKEDGEVVEGLIWCSKCNRFYPIRDEIPEMLPDELRNLREDLEFLEKWKNKIPEKILSEGKPINLQFKRG